jgi:hypothetical protein
MNKGETIVIELAQIRPNAIDYSAWSTRNGTACISLPANTQDMNWTFHEYDSALGFLVHLDEKDMHSIKLARINPESYMNATSIADLESVASMQCAHTINNLMKISPERKFVGFTVIFVGWRVLVRQVQSSTSMSTIGS